MVGGNSAARSWREKLAVVQDVLANCPGGLAQEALVDVAVYLRFLHTGELSCVEDGRHFRPSHHARIAAEIHERLAGWATDENLFLIRRIVACLPSTAAPFQRAEPLTRIRDIAHRNDIPQDLKREIKTTLQNKLHRCAGPEDLVTSTRLLERVTAPGAHYSGDFVAQFKIFHSELAEFFNARTLEDQLASLESRLDPVSRRQLGEFLALKRNRKGHELDLLDRLTEVRRGLLQAAAEKTGAEHQELWLADIALEEYAFTLFSELLNDIATEDGNLIDLARPLVLLLENLRLSRIQPAEATAVEDEIQMAFSQLDPGNRESLLRIKAAVERARRYAGAFVDRVLVQLADRAAVLGNQLKVAPHAIRVFAEGEIRSHLVYQLAKLASALLRNLRSALAQPPWDVLVPGHEAGRLVVAGSLPKLAAAQEPCIALLSHAEGDEEIPSFVRGILLAHELPHLSHLGVRARQAGVVFACCEDAALHAALRHQSGNWVSLLARPDGIELAAAPVVPHIARPPAMAPAAAVPEVKLQSRPAVLPLAEINASVGGNKSEGARRLVELSLRNGAGFSAPGGLVVPFGVMEACLAENPSLRGQYESAVIQVDRVAVEQVARVVGRVREVIHQAPVPDEIVAAAAQQFSRAQNLAVRSSANSEDLPELAGAGLHESVAGTTVDSLRDAVRTVWASLWTERAALSRRQAGIPHASAHMAVLIQPLIEPDLSFILHSVNPLNHDRRECYVELAAGLGETLAGAAVRGTPYRLVCDRSDGRIRMLAFANFEHALEVREGGKLGQRRLNYTRVRFTTDPEVRASLGARLARIAGLVEAEWGQPQDVEGVVRGDEIFLVQSRAQQGISTPL